MLHDISKRLRPGVFLALAILCLPVVASAGTINIILSGVDVSYLGSAAGNTGSIYDSIGHVGGNLNPAESSEVNAAVFEFNMVDQGMLMSSGGNTLYGDLKVDGVGSTLPLTYTPNLGSNGGGFGFDWFDTAGHKVRLGINKVDVLLTAGVFSSPERLPYCQVKTCRSDWRLIRPKPSHSRTRQQYQAWLDSMPVHRQGQRAGLWLVVLLPSPARGWRCPKPRQCSCR